MSDRSTDINGTRASQGKYAKRNANRTKQTRRLPHKEFMGTEIRYGSMPQRVIDAWFDGDFNDKKYKLLSIICCHAPSFHIKFSYLRKRMCPKTVKKFLKELVDEGYVRIESVKMPGGGSETVYHTTELTHWKLYENFEFADIRDQFEGAENEGSLSTPRQPITSSPLNLRQPAEVGVNPLRKSIPVRHRAEVGAAAVRRRPPVNQTNKTNNKGGVAKTHLPPVIKEVESVGATVPLGKPVTNFGTAGSDVPLDNFNFKSFKDRGNKRAEVTQRAEDEITELQKNCSKDYGATKKKTVSLKSGLFNESLCYFTDDHKRFDFHAIHHFWDHCIQNDVVEKGKEILKKYHGVDKDIAAKTAAKKRMSHPQYVNHLIEKLNPVTEPRQKEEPAEEHVSLSPEDRAKRFSQMRKLFSGK